MKKNFTKILFAVPAFVIAVSCAKEIAPVQEETNPAGEISGKVFTTQFEAVKTTLNENRTPIWVEGDAIGVTTADDANVMCELLDVSAGTFNAEAIQGDAPFYAVYPYSADNTFDGDVLTATIPSVQQLAEGQSVASGVLVSACKSNSTTLAFKNCVSLLQITIPRDDIKKVVVAATTKGEKLTGKFTMDLSAETLAPALAEENVDSTVTLLPAGTAFAQGTYYIAVAPVTLKSIQIDFTNTSDETVSVKKTVTTTLGRSAGSNLGSFFVYNLETAEDLITWAKQSAKFTVWDVVNLNADITLTTQQAATYIEAKNFRGQFNGNNHSISGLTCSLFGNLRSAEVSNLTVTANITWNAKTGGQFNGSDYGLGILAHYAYPLDTANGYTRPNPKLTNIKTYGSVTVSGLSLSHNFILGGLVGAENNVPFTNCENNASVTFASGTFSSGSLYVGGLVGASQDGTNAILTNCKNYGDVTIQSNSGVATFVAGVVGYITQAVTHTGSENYGKVELSGFTATASVVVGGISAAQSSAAKFVNCYNEGEVICNANGKYMIVGGLIGNLRYDKSYISNSINKGKVTFGGAAANRCDIGGIIGMTGNDGASQKSGGNYIQNCTNNGDINITGTAGSSSDQFRIGGLIGNLAYGGIIGVDSSSEATPCYNNGNITVNAPQEKHIRVAGICGSTTNVKAELYNLHNTGNVSITISNSKTCQQVDCGGIVGYLGTGPFVIKDCGSKCAITKSGTITTNNFANILGRTGTGAAGNAITNCGVGGSLLGTAITEDNKDTNIYKTKGLGAITISGTYLITE